MSSSVATLADRASALLSATHINYSALQTVSKELDLKIQSVCKNVECMSLLLRCKTALASHTEELALHSRWEKLGHNPEFITTHPDCVAFLVESGLAYQIAGLHNSLIANPERHIVAKDADGHPMIMLEGTMTRWEVIKERFSFLRKYHVLCNKNNEAERWTYTSQAGITARDMYHFNEPFHVFELDKATLSKLQAYAQIFYYGQAPNPAANYILQICTSTGVLCTKQGALLKKIGEKLASHYAIRVITPQGEVYSFGLRRDIGELEFVDMSNALGKVKGRIAMNDYDELRPHSGRYVTTVPITQEAANTILQGVMATNTGIPSFDYFDANCVELAERTLATAGVHVTTTEPLEGCLHDVAVAIFKNIPCLGAAVRKVRQVAKALFSNIPKVPVAVKTGYSFVASLVFFVPNKLLALCKNIFVWKMGWTCQSPALAAIRTTRSISVVDFFNENLSNIRYPRHLLRWQKRQPTTYCHEYKGRPELALIPSDLTR